MKKLRLPLLPSEQKGSDDREKGPGKVLDAALLIDLRSGVGKAHEVPSVLEREIDFAGLDDEFQTGACIEAYRALAGLRAVRGEGFDFRVAPKASEQIRSGEAQGRREVFRVEVVFCGDAGL